MKDPDEVYVLIQNYYEWRELLGVFTTRYRANQAKKKAYDPDSCTIQKVILNFHFKF